MNEPDSNIFSYREENFYSDFKPIVMEAKEEEVENPVQEQTARPYSSTPPGLAPPTKVVRSIEILQYLTGSLAGKDKIAKIIKYVLDILRLLVTNSRLSITKWDPSVLVYYKKVLGTLSMSMILKHPITITKVLLVAVFQNFESKTNFVSQQLSTYRYILRFGDTPFRIFKLLGKIRKTDLSAASIQESWCNESSLVDLIDFYYGICDEMVLLNKLKVWSNAKLYNWFSRHESISWQYSIVLGLKNNWMQLQTLQKRQMELEIQMQVRDRAMKFSSNLKGSSGLTSPIRRQLLNDLNNGSGNDLEIAQKLHGLKHEKTVTYLDLTRLSFDLLANSTDVFRLKTPQGTYAVLSLGSGITGFVKLWMNAKKELGKQE